MHFCEFCMQDKKSATITLLKVISGNPNGEKKMKICKRKLTRELLESFTGKKVKVVFFDNTTREGVLVLGMGIGNGFVVEKPKMYTVGNLCFRLSHIKSIEVER